MCIIFFFFFSSRRRHTRFSRDWSSDVCSSDLRAAFDALEVVRAANADDPQSRLDRAELAYECLPLLVEEDAGDHDVDAYPADDFEGFRRILGAQDTMAGLTKRLIDELLDGGVFLEDEDGRGTVGRHAATLTGAERQRQTQMGLSRNWMLMRR